MYMIINQSPRGVHTDGRERVCVAGSCFFAVSRLNCILVDY